MISFLKGEIKAKFDDSIVLLVGDIGYKVYINEPLLLGSNEGDFLEMFTYQSFSDAGQSLFGFKVKEQLVFFEKIIQVSGIGPRLAMNILESPIDIIKQAIINRDIALLVEFPGIGKKTAERLCLELQNKVEMPIASLDSRSTDSDNKEDTHKTHATPLCNEEAFDALQTLGFSRLEAHRMIAKVPSNVFDTESIVREALKTKDK